MGGRFIKILFQSCILILWILSGCATFNLGPVIAPLKEKVISGKGPEKVLLLDISGVIRNKEKRSLTGATLELGLVERVREILDMAEKDEDIKALLIRINSPGGTVTSSDIIYHEIKTYKKRKGVKVYVSIVDLAASGGYYIAVAGDQIVAHPTSLIGSIGVIALKINLQGLFEKIGVDWEVVKSAEKKDFLSPLRPLTREERKLFQFTIDHYHQRFLQVIAENRPGLDLAAVGQLADGRMYTSDQALENKMIDRIGYLDDVMDLIKTDLESEDPEVITYQRPGEYKPNLYSQTPVPPTINFINVNLGLDLESPVPHFMYLWMP